MGTIILSQTERFSINISEMIIKKIKQNFDRRKALIVKSICIYLSVSVFACSKPGAQDSTSQHVGAIYELVEDWPGVGADSVLGQPSGIGVDSEGKLYIFHRGLAKEKAVPGGFIAGNTILKVDVPTGQVLDAWGANQFFVPHGLNVDGQDNIWLTDVGLHQVFKFNAQGELLMKLGVAGTPGTDSLHFNKPTDIAVAGDGSFYVTDGYGNSRVIKFSPTGEYLFEWGKKGSNPGEFDLPHAIDLDQNGNVLVADRENARIQKFDPSGRFIAEWKTTTGGKVYSMNVDQTNQEVFSVDYLVENDTVILGSNISHLHPELKFLTHFGRDGAYDGPVSRYHDIEVDGYQNIFVADLIHKKVQRFQRINQNQNK